MLNVEGAAPTVLVIGATSAIAQATAREFAKVGARLFLVARDPHRLESVAGDLLSRGATRVETRAAELTDAAEHARITAAAFTALGTISHVLISYGVLPDPARANDDPAYARETLDINFLSPASLCMHLAPHLEAQQGGCLAVVGSVAGDRIRLSNYVYGTAKSALESLLDGLRLRLESKGVTVLLIKPGFIDTPMTAALKKGLLFSSAERAGQAIFKRMTKASSGSVYVPGFWRSIMAILRILPRPVFKRLPI